MRPCSRRTSSGWTVWSVRRPPVTHRFVATTASDLHVLVPARNLNYDSSFSPPRIHSLALMSDGAGHSKYSVTVTFYAIAVH